jgi:hypothetical protein
VGPVLVTDPALQFLQAVSVEMVEYRPAVHAAHTLAPTWLAVFVIKPGPHAVHTKTSGRVE